MTATPPPASPYFLLAVAGDPGLPEMAYPFVRAALDRLLARRLPRANVAFLLADTVGRLADRYAVERRAIKTGVPGRDDSAVELLRSVPKAVVVFSAGGAGEAELRP